MGEYSVWSAMNGWAVGRIDDYGNKLIDEWYKSLTDALLARDELNAGTAYRGGAD